MKRCFNVSKGDTISFSCFLRPLECKLWILRAIHLMKISLGRIRPNCFFERPECRKCVLMAFRHHESSLQQHHLSRTLRCSEGILFVLWRIRQLKISLKRLPISRFFWCPGCRKWVCLAFLPVYKWVPVTTAWPFLRLGDGEMASDLEVSNEYIE
jgi:hypothetical protein